MDVLLDKNEIKSWLTRARHANVFCTHTANVTTAPWDCIEPAKRIEEKTSNRKNEPSTIAGRYVKAIRLVADLSKSLFRSHTLTLFSHRATLF